MQMKKNTKSKDKNKDFVTDSLVVIGSLLVMVFSLFMFFTNLYKTFTRTDKEEIATITFKYKAVQRKFIDSAVWDRPIHHSPVYNGDIIRTSPDAEATIEFKDLSMIKLGSSTMVQVFKDKEKEESSVNLASGAVAVQTATSSKMVVNSSESSITVDSDSALRADKSDEKKLKLIVEKGEASVLNELETGEAEVLKAGQVNEIIDNTVEGDAAVPTATGSITMITPANNLKILNQRQNGVPAEVLFKWHSTFDKNEELVLETSTDKNFTRNIEKFPINEIEEKILKPKSGYFYWRAYSAKKGFADSSAASGKLMVLSAPSPKLLSPKVDTVFTFKHELPPINFIWEGNEFAGAYLLEIADNPQMTSPKFSQNSNITSLSVSGLSEGKWYWRVSPQYFLGLEFEAEKSPVYSFGIEKTEDIPPAEFIAPERFGDKSKGKNLNFSWSVVSEAKKYNIKISKSSDMSNPIFEGESNTNNFELSKDIKDLENGEYYLTVSSLGKNGDVLSTTEPQKFIARDTDLILRSIFPPNGYTIADTFCVDTRFTWKSNFPGNHKFQVSSKKDFSDIILEEVTPKTAISGINLKEGSWYWRVVGDTTEKLVSDVKQVIVAPPLSRPELVNASGRISIVKGERNKIQWKPLRGIDYYQVKVLLPGRDAAPLYEDLFITKNEIDLDLQNIADGTYIISVQGFSTPTAMSTRRYSLAVDHYTLFKHIKPVELVYPVGRTRLSGVSAALKNPVFKWKTHEPPGSSQLIIEKSQGRGAWKSIAKIDNPQTTAEGPKLAPGSYRWILKATTVDGLDISSRNDGRFIVSPIPPLPKPKILAPAHKAVFNADYFKKNKSITISVGKVKNGTHYIIEIYTPDKKKKIFSKLIQDKKNNSDRISVEFKKLSVLTSGNFIIEAKAQRRKDGDEEEIFQNGLIRTAIFKIDLPQIKKVNTHDTGILYGK